MGDQKVPSIGRIVHFVYGDKHIPAFITDPDYHMIDPAEGEAPIQQALTVFPVFGAPFSTTAVFDPNGASATWHWPEYVPNQ